MSLSDEPVTRRPIVLPVLIAAVCLTIIGASFGYVLSVDIPQRDPASNVAQQSTSVSPSPRSSPISSAPTSAPASPKPSTPGPKPTPSPTAPAPSGPVPCPELTQWSVQGHGGDVGTVYQRIRLKTREGTVALICISDSGEMYYHAARNVAEAEWRNGVNALFIPGVRQEGSAYVAKHTENDGSVTTITVTSKQWVLKKAGQDPVIENAAG